MRAHECEYEPSNARQGKCLRLAPESLRGAAQLRDCKRWRARDCTLMSPALPAMLWYKMADTCALSRAGLHVPLLCSNNSLLQHRSGFETFI